jgi:radical SAM superfamily enzyme YgiQ (UPF0313 family)
LPFVHFHPQQETNALVRLPLPGPAAILVTVPDIVLTTLNSKYIHTAFGLRYLLANLGNLRSVASIREFDINQRPVDIAETLLAENPTIIGIGVYIWNANPVFELVSVIKRVRPEVIVLIGGPEVSYEIETQPIAALADYILTGEADLKFAEVCRRLLEGERPNEKVIVSQLPDFTTIRLPYDTYTDEDLRHRLVYVEASRGCPFTCEFCLSSLDVPVRQAPLPEFLASLQQLLDRGLKHFKFVDRTFNLNLNVSRAILEFFLARYQPGHFFHFEMVPDRLPEQLRKVIALFPAGSLQFEVGIQTFNEEVAARIKRRQNYQRLEENLSFLRNQTGVYIHADLIVGLPGEDLESFAAGFDRLINLGPQEIQVGILKRLRGTPIVRHDADWQMVYNSSAPYELLQNRMLSFATMQRLRRFSRYWDLVGNSGNFVETTPLLWNQPTGSNNSSPFYSFLAWSDWLYRKTRRTDSIALVRLMELLFEYLKDRPGHEPHLVAAIMLRDYERGGRKDQPSFLRNYLPVKRDKDLRELERPNIPKRQARHGLARSTN